MSETKPIAITDASFEDDVLKADKPVVVDFWAEWCGPCKAIAPMLEELAAERSDVTIAKLNIDENGEATAKYGIRGIPTLLLFKGGEVVDTKVGAPSNKNALAQWIDQHS
ncbi:MAG: thioredoxin [Pseudomonadota bacterium]